MSAWWASCAWSIVGARRVAVRQGFLACAFESVQCHLLGGVGTAPADGTVQSHCDYGGGRDQIGGASSDVDRLDAEVGLGDNETARARFRWCPPPFAADQIATRCASRPKPRSAYSIVDIRRYPTAFTETLRKPETLLPAMLPNRQVK